MIKHLVLYPTIYCMASLLFDFKVQMLGVEEAVALTSEEACAVSQKTAERMVAASKQVVGCPS